MFRCEDCIEEYGIENAGLCDVCHVDLLEQEEMERNGDHVCGCREWKKTEESMCKECNDHFDAMIEELGHMSQERMDMLYLNSR